MTDSQTVVIATRSEHKLLEIVRMLPFIPRLKFASLTDAQIPWSAEEEHIEVFGTFEENALAKARFFHARAGGRAVLADDSGIAVDALAGRPGVRSKRFAPVPGLVGQALDDANNRYLLELLEGSPAPRTARYVCAIAVVLPDGSEYLFRGSVEGEITVEPSGTGGFGYDPLFFVPALQATFGQVDSEVKDRLSHRGQALRQAVPLLNAYAAAATGVAPRSVDASVG